MNTWHNKDEMTQLEVVLEDGQSIMSGRSRNSDTKQSFEFDTKKEEFAGWWSISDLTKIDQIGVVTKYLQCQADADEINYGTQSIEDSNV